MILIPLSIFTLYKLAFKLQWLIFQIDCMMAIPAVYLNDTQFTHSICWKWFVCYCYCYCYCSCWCWCCCLKIALMNKHNEVTYVCIKCILLISPTLNLTVSCITSVMNWFFFFFCCEMPMQKCIMVVLLRYIECLYNGFIDLPATDQYWVSWFLHAHTCACVFVSGLFSHFPSGPVCHSR